MQVDQLQALPLFEGVSVDRLKELAGSFTEVVRVGGTGLAKQDDFAYKFFIVLDGEVDIYRDFKLITRLGKNEFFGEMALLNDDEHGSDEHTRRNARVITHSECRLACLMRWDFKKMIEDLPEVASRIQAVADERSAPE